MDLMFKKGLAGTVDYSRCFIYSTVCFYEDLLSSSPPSGTIEPKAITNARRWYNSCINLHTREKETFDSFAKFMDREFGGWPAVSGTTWNESTFDFYNLMLKLNQYNQFILYTVATVIDEENSSSRIIQVRFNC
jgi:hypothetical protein